ncbi:MAG: DUF2029 domain-containing protein [Candidatus Hydrogenedentota bacterium]|nr:MAG: DUF2029 domain-containing protein [Candidatus Hydrogenedentota bacterium]
MPDRRAAIAVSGLVLTAVLSLLHLAPAARTARIASWIAVLVFAGTLHLLLLSLFFFRHERRNRCTEETPGCGCGAGRNAAPEKDENTVLHSGLAKRELAVILLFAAAMRLVLVPLSPVLSDDAYRNIWDGRVQAAGVDPYRYPPSAEELSALRDNRVWPRINHKEYRTIYPPAAQILSRGIAPIRKITGWRELTAWKVEIFLCEFLGLVLLGAGLIARRREGHRALLWWAYSPLAAVEFAGSGHLDGAAVGMVGAALGLWLLRKRVGAGVCAALAVGIKIIPIAAGAAIPRVRRKEALLGGALLASLLVVIPYLSAGSDLFETLKEYNRNWEFNGVLHRSLHVDSWVPAVENLVSFPASPRRLAPGTPREKGIARAVASGLVLSAGFLWSLTASNTIFVATMTLLLFLLVQPVIYPWYLTHLLPWLCLVRSGSVALFLVLSGLTYEVLLTEARYGVWRERVGLQRAIVFLFVAAAVGEVLYRRRMRGYVEE